MHHSAPRILATACALLFLAACARSPEPVAESRFVEPDRLFEIIETNIRNHQPFELVTTIDHARLAAEAGEPMSPSRVLIWSDPELDAAILQHNPLAAVDLPLRILSFENPETGKAAVITNSFDFVASRHGLPDEAGLGERYETAIATAIRGIEPGSVATFASDDMTDTGLVTLDSPHDVGKTEALLMDVINAQSDTVHFATVDFAERAKSEGVDLKPLRLILFGAPGPGGQAMRDAPTLGLDAFCQKLLVWEDENGGVHVTFNDLLALAERQLVPVNIPLRVVNRRIKKTFSEALEQSSK